MAVALRRVDDRPDRLHVRLDRPEVRNAIDRTMVGELHELCAELEAAPRILILSGTERVFASGADIAELRERGRDDALAGINSRLFLRIAALPMPVIAAVDGWALGGGAELAYAADFRLAGENARFGHPEVGLGIIAGAGATWRLKELVGETLALEILLAGRVLDAQEALAAGLVSEVEPPSALIAAADGLADRIAEQDPTAVRYTKRVFRAPREAHPEVDELAQSVLFESPAKRDRMTAFLTRKTRS
ncbi:enoyl-CoA hydratase/isomerase family protein [Promicromonospora sp. NPDC057138]|uniref:enoyl-CoA hydratase/isomerase family protein n=1 Tax=Promicromonospora sp. NPDC057138 TaxID=3346031 RepID=UPI00363BC284